MVFLRNRTQQIQKKYHTNHDSGTERFGSYSTGQCFWQALEDKYGHGAIVSLVQFYNGINLIDDMDGAQKYDMFFQSFKDVTGMNDADASNYFGRFSIPVEYPY